MLKLRDLLDSIKLSQAVRSPPRLDSKCQPTANRPLENLDPFTQIIDQDTGYIRYVRSRYQES